MSTAEQYRFKYRIFASVDLVGSTAFKSTKSSTRDPWAKLFREFFEDFPVVLQDEHAKLGAAAYGPNDPMLPWKFAGDEILLQSELTRHEQVAFHLAAFKLALNRYEETLRTKQLPLLLKGTVWGAGFPCRNVEVRTRNHAKDPLTLDFLGESIDFGFRIARFASPRRIPISPDIGYFLVRCLPRVKEQTGQICLFVGEPESLKGIRHDRPQPMIWLDRWDGRTTAEDKILNRRKPNSTAEIEEYLDWHFASPDTSGERPFLVSDPDPSLQKVPQDIEDWRQRLERDESGESYAADVDARDPVQPPNATNTPPAPNKD